MPAFQEADTSMPGSCCCHWRAYCALIHLGTPFSILVPQVLSGTTYQLSRVVQGKLTVVLDLDGTLVSSFTPRRAPHLPPGMNTYLVGKGSQLNPNGVFVVERPELRAFFDSLSTFAGMPSTPYPGGAARFAQDISKHWL